MPSVLKSGSPNLLEPSGPVQACNEIALPLSLFRKDAVTIYVPYEQATVLQSMLTQKFPQNQPMSNHLSLQTSHGTQYYKSHLLKCLTKTECSCLNGYIFMAMNYENRLSTNPRHRSTIPTNTRMAAFLNTASWLMRLLKFRIRL